MKNLQKEDLVTFFKELRIFVKEKKIELLKYYLYLKHSQWGKRSLYKDSWYEDFFLLNFSLDEKEITLIFRESGNWSEPEELVVNIPILHVDNLERYLSILRIEYNVLIKEEKERDIKVSLGEGI